MPQPHLPLRLSSQQSVACTVCGLLWLAMNVAAEHTPRNTSVNKYRRAKKTIQLVAVQTGKLDQVHTLGQSAAFLQEK